MDKGQALQTFWASFGLPAYEQGTVPEEAVMPYITYNVAFGNFDSTVTLNGDLWYQSKAWKDADQKTEQISQAIGRRGYRTRIDGGHLWIKKQMPKFSEHEPDTDDMVRRVRLFIEADFLTEN